MPKRTIGIRELRDMQDGVNSTVELEDHLAVERTSDELLRHLDVGHGIDPNSHESDDLDALEARHGSEHEDA